jgi:hypothetical protein
MDDNVKEFIIAYAALCKKHQLCVAPEAWTGGLYLVEYDKDWIEDIALSEGVEMFETCEVKL